ncbi:MAG: SH3 domain-containing protein [Rhodospirillales bacterium]
MPLRRPPTRSPLAALLLGLGLGFGFGPAPAVASEGGLPLPRFVTVRAGEANLRTGPGTRYPVEWVYRRPGLPLEIIAEFDTWRRVRDWQGIDGWMHAGMLSGQRSVVITGEGRVLRERDDPASPVLARVEAGVVGRLLECPAGSAACRIEAGGVRGWIDRTTLWGVYEGEVVR